VVEVDLGRQDLEIERLMQPAEGEVHGRVRDGNDRPIEGVRVTLSPDDGLTPTAVVWTDARGLFEIADLSPGPGAIELDHPDYAPARRGVRVGRRGGAALELTMLAGWDLELSVRARGSGEPIAGARVEVDDDLWTTDADGALVVRRLAGESARVAVRAGGWVGQTQVVRRPEGGPAALQLELDEAAGMEGEVTDERGEPVGGARVVVRSVDGQVLAETRTTADGHWSVPDLPEGDVVVEAIPPTALAEILAPVAVESDVRRGHLTREVDLRFDRL
jgi:protocatechuate 3,4-dioxygenase beta subunit